MKIEKIKRSDIPKVIELFKIAYPAAWKKTGRRFNKKHFASELKKALKKDRIFSIENLGWKEMIAFGWAGHQTGVLGNKYGEIKLPLIHPAYQNYKLGPAILRILEKILKTKDLRLFVLSFNRAKKMYKITQKFFCFSDYRFWFCWPGRPG